VFINEVKKALYKQKKLAHRVSQSNFVWQYQCDVEVNGHPFTCNFSVPTSDMGETEFTDSIQAQLLIRYLDIL
jgi:hypothetical protein